MNSSAQMVLNGVDAKIRLAEVQIKDLCEEIEDFEDAQERCVKRIEYQGGQEFIYTGDPKCPIEWSIRVGDIVHKLRSALDHLVTYMVLSNGHPSSLLNRKHRFPIYRSKDSYCNHVANDLRGVNSIAKAKIFELQPFIDFKENLSLWSLHCLNIIDKHRHLRIMNAYTIGPHSISMPRDSQRQLGLHHIARNLDMTLRGFEPLETGARLYRYDDLQPTLATDDLDIQVEVLFDDMLLAQREPFISFDERAQPTSKTYSNIETMGPRGSVRLVLERLTEKVTRTVEDLAST